MGGILSYYIQPKLCKADCPHFKSCCKLPTEVHDNNTATQIMIVGQGAGKEEDKQHRPWIGPAGQLFRDLYKSVMTVPSLAMSNNVRCHPMDKFGKDREPYPNELKHCFVHLAEDIVKVDPIVILLMGKSAAESFGYSGTVGSMRKLPPKVYTYKDYAGWTMVTYHPAGVLPHRRPENKRFLQEDLERAIVMSRPKVQRDPDQMALPF